MNIDPTQHNGGLIIAVFAEHHRIVQQPADCRPKPTLESPNAVCCSKQAVHVSFGGIYQFSARAIYDINPQTQHAAAMPAEPLCQLRNTDETASI